MSPHWSAHVAGVLARHRARRVRTVNSFGAIAVDPQRGQGRPREQRCSSRSTTPSGTHPRGRCRPFRFRRTSPEGTSCGVVSAGCRARPCGAPSDGPDRADRRRPFPRRRRHGPGAGQLRCPTRWRPSGELDGRQPHHADPRADDLLLAPAGSDRPGPRSGPERQERLRSSRRSTFPLTVLGISSMMSTCRGYL
jgi:hypothetical protein